MRCSAARPSAQRHGGGQGRGWRSERRQLNIQILAVSAGARGSHIGSSGIPWNSHPPWLCCNTVSSSVAELDTRAGSEVSSSCYTAKGKCTWHTDSALCNEIMDAMHSYATNHTPIPPGQYEGGRQGRPSAGGPAAAGGAPRRGRPLKPKNTLRRQQGVRSCLLGVSMNPTGTQQSGQQQGGGQQPHANT